MLIDHVAVVKAVRAKKKENQTYEEQGFINKIVDEPDQLQKPLLLKRNINFPSILLSSIGP